MISPIPHATLSSAITQTVTTINTAYPVLLEGTDDVEGVYRKTATITVSIASPAVVTWTAHGLPDGAPVVFTTTGALPTGITAGTPYYIRSTGIADPTNTFWIYDNFDHSIAGGATGRVDTSGTQSGVHTGTAVSRVYVPERGEYEIIISALIDTTSNTTVLLDLWFDLNGSPVAKSNTQVAVTTTGVQSTLAVALILDLAAGDYIRMWYSANNTAGRLLAIGTQVSPTRPACPSIIFTMKKIGNNV